MNPLQFLCCTLWSSVLLWSPLARAQDRAETIRVYVDCEFCDLDYIKTEIPFVAYVRDRHEAELHVLITRESTGGGGREYTLFFLGRHELTGKSDTAKFATKEAESDDVMRVAMVRTLKLGLVRYLAGTAAAEKLTISSGASAEKDSVVDVWDFWVIKTTLNTYLSGEKSRSAVSLNGDVAASRVTPALKTRLSAFASYAENRFDIDGSTILSTSRGKGVEGYMVFSLDEQWSAGFDAGASSSTYQNRDVRIYGGPAVEYNLFPYTESNRRELRVALSPSYSYTAYKEESIFDRTSEHLVRNSLSITLELKQLWGSVETQLEGSHYLHDFNKNRLDLMVETSLRLVEGLSLDIYATLSLIHDQLSLPKRGASTEEVLLRRRELSTQYNYYCSVGFSYAFGSIYSAVVNPRFGNF